jgi:hypothetical protein
LLTAVIVVSKPKLLVAGVFAATVKERVIVKVVVGFRVWLL